MARLVVSHRRGLEQVADEAEERGLELVLPAPHGRDDARSDTFCVAAARLLVQLRAQGAEAVGLPVVVAAEQPELPLKPVDRFSLLPQNKHQLWLGEELFCELGWGL